MRFFPLQNAVCFIVLISLVSVLFTFYIQGVLNLKKNSGAKRLITHTFDGDKRKLREFIENVDVVFELVNPAKHDVLLKFVKAKITGDARSKLMVRDLTHGWELVKAILEENYATRRTLDYYACRMSSARYGKNESVASCGNKTDELQTDLREAVRWVC